jgi:hypothetical protein
MNKNKRVAAALAFVLIAISSTAVAAQTDITGAWLFTLEFPQGKTTVEANIKQTDDKFAGEVATPAGNLQFDGTLVKNEISAVYSLPLHGNVLEIRMVGVVDADTLSGTIEFGAGQQLKWTAVRKPLTSVPETAGTTPADDSAPKQDAPGDAQGSTLTK